MKTLFTLIALFICGIVFGQSDRYHINLNVAGSYETTKTIVKDYDTCQLICGTYNVDGTIHFWIAKMTGNTLAWAKSVPAHPNWNYLDISPLDIAQCGSNGDLIFIGKGNLNANYSTRVIKLNSSGNLIWSKEILAQVGTYSQTVYEHNPMIVENDGVIISMAGENHLQITKLSLDGNLVYSRQLKVTGTVSGPNPGHLFIKDHTGGYLAGFDCDYSPALVHLDGSMNVTWAKKITQAENAALRSLSQTESGDILIGGMTGTSPGTFAARLNPNGTVQHYATFPDAELYSIDQLLEADINNLLAMGRTGYIHINMSDWSCYKLEFDSPFCSFDKTNTGWSFGSAWNMDYYLNFNWTGPQCFAYTGPVQKNTVAVTANDVAITCTVATVGTLNTYSPVLTSIPATLENDCFLSLSENQPVEFSIYPNPAHAGEIILFSGNLIPDEHTPIILTDLQGHILAEMPFESIIALPELSAGAYFVNIHQNGRIHTQKLIIE